jgi:hypothetical protein
MTNVTRIDEEYPPSVEDGRYGGNPFSTKKSATLQEQIISLQEQITSLQEQIATLQEVPEWVNTKEAAKHEGMSVTAFNQHSFKKHYPPECYKWVGGALRWNLRALDRLPKKKKKKSDDDVSE